MELFFPRVVSQSIGSGNGLLPGAPFTNMV